MISIVFEDGSVLVELGALDADVPAAIRSACSKMGVGIEQVEAIGFPDSECCEAEYLSSLLSNIKQKLRDEEQNADMQFAIDALQQYANPENWSGVSNRHQVLQRRWKGGGQGADLARKALDRLKKHHAPLGR